MIYRTDPGWLRFLAMVGALLSITAMIGMVSVAICEPRTVEDSYPGLATGLLKSASLAELSAPNVLVAGKIKIAESEIQEAIEGVEPALKEQLKKNMIFLLEQMVTERLILAEAREVVQDNRTMGDKEAIGAHLRGLAEKVSVSDEECKGFYENNRELLPGVTFEQAKEAIRAYVLGQKRQAVIAKYIQGLGSRTPIQVDAAWVKAQSASALDNPVDKARRSGVPTLVEFGATGCKPCDMMQPILENLRKKYGQRLNVLFVHVGEEQVLGARFGIEAIPVQAFFDRSGREVFRHEGFFPQEEVERKLREMGLP